MAGERLVVASHNAGKVWEIRTLLAPFGVEAVSAGDLGLAEPDETEATFTGNAALKARAAASASGLPALADDSGLEVACLGGAPGIYSARWAGLGKDFGLAMRKVAEEITARHGWAAPGPRANFITALCLAWPDGHQQLFEGRIDGVLVWPPRGANGFGYDPMFMPDGHAITFGEMDPAAKNAMSHRARAFAAFEAACLGAACLGAARLRARPADGEVRGPSIAEGFAAAAQAISTREELVRFVANLREDAKANPPAWPTTVDGMLDRFGDHATHMVHMPGEPVWRALAKALLSGRRGG